MKMESRNQRKLLLLPVAAVIFGSGLIQAPKPKIKVAKAAPIIQVIITGGAHGTLSPCGCTKPMSGGMKRLVTLVQELRKGNDSIWIDTGDVTAEPGRQSEMKFETYAQMLGKNGADAIAYTRQDQQLGEGVFLSADSLSKGNRAKEPIRWLSSSAQEGTSNSTTLKNIILQPRERSNINQPFLRKTGQSTIAIVDGGLDLANQVASQASLVVFTSDGVASAEGRIISPGSGLRGLVVAKFQNGRLLSTRAVSVGAEIHDHPETTKIYRGYLARIRGGRLLDQVPKTSTDEYVGSANCSSCHADAAKVHLSSMHAKAYKTLEHEGHESDPDCVSCHVVGLDSPTGFTLIRKDVFGEVGCESCHGAGKAHSSAPLVNKLGKVGEEKCLTCHTPQTSPKFNFATMWAKIQHK